MTSKKFCTYAFDELARPHEPARKLPVGPEIVEAALVQPALVLDDGRAIVMSYDQMVFLNKTLREYISMLAPQPARNDEAVAA